MSSKYSLHDLSTDSEEDDENLEVLPPKAATAKERHDDSDQSTRRRGPRLSASGGDLADPIALLDDDDDESDQEDLSLAERLGRSKAMSAADPDGQPRYTSNSQKPGSSAMRKNAPVTSSIHNTSDSDNDSRSSRESLAQKLTAIRKKPPAKKSALDMASLSSDNDSCSSDDSLSKRVKQITQPRAKSNQVVAKNSSRAVTHSTNRYHDDVMHLSQDSSVAAAPKPKRQQVSATERLEKQREKEVERLRKQQERDQLKSLKEQEKLARKRARDAKLEAERTEKRRRQEQKQDSKQKKGGFANQEIAVLMDPDLFRHPELTITDELQEAKYNVYEHASMLGCKTIQFIRQDLVRGAGGAEGAMAAMRAGDRKGFEHLPVVGVVFDNANDFIQLLERDDREEDDYPKLEVWLRSFQAGWRAAWKCEPKQKPRIILYLYRVSHVLERLWIEYKRSKRPSFAAPPSDEELKDAIAWLLIQFQVECVECRENDHLSLELGRLTRKISDKQYQKAYSDLDVSQKLAPLCGSDASPYAQAKDCWMRQMQQVPGVSFNMARTLVQHYPTGYSLWKMYQDPTTSDDEKRALLVDCFGARTCPKLSDQVYQLMTSDDPNVLLI